jgi:hypothetical protein
MYVGDSPARHGLLGLAMAMMQLDIVFETLRIPQVTMSVKDSNDRALLFNTQLGYREHRRDAGLVYLRVNAAGYATAKAGLLRYFPQPVR